MQLYRVVHGALCHYMCWGDGSPKIIEFVFKDDIVGFAHGEEHVTTTRALVPTEVRVVTTLEFSDALETDGCLAARVAAASDREFEYLRFCAVRSGGGRPAMRVASFLAALVRMRVREGRDPELIAGDVSSAIIAEALHLSVDSLAAAVIELERRGLIRLTPGGLRIVNVDLLERLFD